jgi:hypothetical protein
VSPKDATWPWRPRGPSRDSEAQRPRPRSLREDSDSGAGPRLRGPMFPEHLWSPSTDPTSMLCASEYACAYFKNSATAALGKGKRKARFGGPGQAPLPAAAASSTRTCVDLAALEAVRASTLSMIPGDHSLSSEKAR